MRSKNLLAIPIAILFCGIADADSTSSPAPIAPQEGTTLTSVPAFPGIRFEAGSGAAFFEVSRSPATKTDGSFSSQTTNFPASEEGGNSVGYWAPFTNEFKEKQTQLWWHADSYKNCPEPSKCPHYGPTQSFVLDLRPVSKPGQEAEQAAHAQQCALLEERRALLQRQIAVAHRAYSRSRTKRQQRRWLKRWKQSRSQMFQADREVVLEGC